MATETIIIRCAARYRAMGAVTAGGHRSNHFGGGALVHLLDGVLTGVTSGAAIERPAQVMAQRRRRRSIGPSALARAHGARRIWRIARA